jgi:hypothetical protein
MKTEQEWLETVKQDGCALDFVPKKMRSKIQKR